VGSSGRVNFAWNDPYPSFTITGKLYRPTCVNVSLIAQGPPGPEYDPDTVAYG